MRQKASRVQSWESFDINADRGDENENERKNRTRNDWFRIVREFDWNIMVCSCVWLLNHSYLKTINFGIQIRKIPAPIDPESLEISAKSSYTNDSAPIKFTQCISANSLSQSKKSCDQSDQITFRWPDDESIHDRFRLFKVSDRFWEASK
jgi:hypothetical protein